MPAGRHYIPLQQTAHSACSAATGAGYTGPLSESAAGGYGLYPRGHCIRKTRKQQKGDSHSDYYRFLIQIASAWFQGRG